MRVSVELLGGAAPRPTDSPSTCKFWPRLGDAKMDIFGALTVAVMEVAPLPFGVVKPAGVVMTRFVVPVVKGWKVLEPKDVSPAKTTGLVTTVPTAVLELLMDKLTVSPVRMFCVDWNVSVAGFSCPETRLNPESGENVVVEKLPVFHTNPEGVRFTVAVPLLKPAAVAVN